MHAPEKTLLIKMAIDKYNSQFGTEIPYNSVRIYSIPPNENTDLGYEIDTNILTDDLRLRIYLVFDDTDILYNYRLEVDNTFKPGELGDEVLVSLGLLDRAHIYNDGYHFHWIDPKDNVPDNALLTEDGIPLLTEEGDYLTMEAGNG